MKLELIKELKEENYQDELTFIYKGHQIEIWVNHNGKVLTLVDGKEVGRTKHCDTSYNNLQSVINKIDKEKED